MQCTIQLLFYGLHGLIFLADHIAYQIYLKTYLKLAHRDSRQINVPLFDINLSVQLLWEFDKILTE